MHERLSHKQSAAMIALMVHGREMANPELRKTAGFALDGKDRLKLNERYVSSKKSGRAFVHQLTDDGWDWCEEELAALTPPQPVRSTLTVVAYQALHGFFEYLRLHKVSLKEVFAGGDAPQAADLEELIRTAYRKLARSPRDWVGLADLRPLLGDAAVAEVDAVLKQLSRTGQAHLVPESNRKALTAEDKEAAVRIGGEDNHLLSIEVS
ncbi:hypothetical protein ATK30_6988 [Amycolatopsis echigonensis]|jgi:hypothetical protein|uniref:Uncharacterized protein n=1 Tax=Amycolatopsis echigonensis TaxID=2576905 RepID=A0A2N3WQB9_9PSEU|nr:hypothetical protein [Amycolatopsis niigatensis]PKV96052.1 hypothetical protein ATK30_6988 [Amycolatopsis niigatensis]